MYIVYIDVYRPLYPYHFGIGHMSSQTAGGTSPERSGGSSSLTSPFFGLSGDIFSNQQETKKIEKGNFTNFHKDVLFFFRDDCVVCVCE